MNTLRLLSPVRGRWFFTRTEIDRLLTASMLFSCILVLVRVVHTDRLTFLSMIWNLFLAYVPYAISTWMTAHPMRRPLTILLSLFWLLFIPNSFYILTDLYHLADGHRNSRVPEWFDLSLILSFAWNGLLLGILSVRQMEKILIPGVPGAPALRQWLFLCPVMWLNALGIYIGRCLRYNSWDIFVNPFQLLADIFSMLIHPLRHYYAWDMIFCFSILLTLFYSLIKKCSKELSDPGGSSK
jgi:uncharacterized membrane protein